MIRFLLFLPFFFALTSGSSQTADIPSFLDRHKHTLGISDDDLKEFYISNQYTTERLGISHVYIQQVFKDIKAHNGILNLNIKDNQLLSFGNRWIPQLDQRAPSVIPTITASVAVVRSSTHLGYALTNPVVKAIEKNGLGQETSFLFESGNVSEQDITAELTWMAGASKNVLLCWMVTIFEVENENVWLIFIDAHDGTFIRKDNMVRHCEFGTPHEVNRDCRKHQIQPECQALPFSLAPDSSYNVFAMPVESPNHGMRSLVTTPWTEAGAGNNATTLGWHHDGTTLYTSTRGNNVNAYEDIDNNNVPGYSPDTNNFRFDYPFDPTLPPVDNVAAAITNLFYWNNILHDVMYQYGFDEVAGNFQNDNLGRGGIANDYVRAEAQDGGGSNNANFFTPSDGSRPRMQMYLWSGVSEFSPLTINSPASIDGHMFAVESAFSNANKLEDIGLTTGDLLLVEDSSGPTHEACGTLSNAEELPGKIAVIDRGNCNFVVKVKTAQNLGAIAAIVINNVAGAPFAMGGTDNSIVIPAVMISMDDGNLLKAVLDTGVVNVDLDAVESIIPDGDYDSGIIAHEYGHGISNRLTGGPSNVNCLNNDEQMGEGWSDFFGLMLTTDWNEADPNDRRGIGTYVLGEPIDGDGIRTYPYTTDTLINPFTYADITDAPLNGGNPSPHFVGSIWCTMLWDMTWRIIEMEGIDPDIYHGTGGNNIALQLVIDGLKLQPCNPGFVDGRDAILLADELNYGGIHRCAIWKAFADRGLGYGASQGSSNNHLDGTVSFDIPDGVMIQSKPEVSVATEGQEVTFLINTTCGCTGLADIVVEDVLSDDLTYIPGSGGALVGSTLSFSADTLLPLDSLSFSYRAFVNPCSPTDTSLLSTENAEGADKYVTIKLSGSGTKQWVKQGTQFVSPENSWYAQDYSTFGDFVLKLITPVETSGPVEISFYHRYQTEENYDGGVVEYSLDSGDTWLDAGPFFVQNEYPDVINTTGTDSPLAGREAFTGFSDVQFSTTAFVHSRIHLGTVNGQSLLIRFRFASDSGVGGSGLNGWYIDDINIIQLSGISNLTRVMAQGTPIDSQYYSLQTSFFEGNTIYVDETAAGIRNGQSWGGALHYLPMALAVADCRSIDSIFIASGSYVPDLDTNRLASFVLPDSLAVYGGFPPGGSPFVQRDPAIHNTILSGDIGILNDYSDNVYHVLQVPSGASGVLLDGLQINNGNANGTADQGKGAAILCEGEIVMKNIIMALHHGNSDGQIILNRGINSQMKLMDCIIYSPADNFIKILNRDSGLLLMEGMTEIIHE